MAVRIAPVGRQQFFSNLGIVAAGMKLFTYAAGTTTKLSTYTDSTGNTANANPVVLDSAGRTPSGLWLTDGSLYKFVLAPANDTDPPTSPIWTEDNIGTTEPSLANLASTSDAALGDALIGFKQSNAGGHLTGASARTVHTKLQEIVSVLDFGATADGAVDDRTALQNAVNTGKIVSLAGRTIGIGSQITWAQNGGGIIGPGAIVMLTGGGQFTNTTNASKFATNSCGIYLSGYDDVVLEGFKVSLGGTPAEASECIAIGIQDSERTRVRHCEFTGFKRADGIVSIDSSFDGDVMLNYFHDCSTDAATTGQLTGVSVDDSRVGGVSSKRINISFNKFESLTVGAAFLASFGYQTDAININYEGSELHTIVGNQIYLVGEGIDHFGKNSIIAGNIIEDAYGWGIKLIHGASHNNVYGNVIDAPGLGGIVLSGSSTTATHLEYNHIHGNVIREVNVAGNWTASTTYGIGVIGQGAGTSDVKNNTIRGNTIYSTAANDYGLLSDDVASGGNIWVDNRLFGSFAVARVYNVNAEYFRAVDKSHVRAQRTATNQTIATATETDIIFNTESIDRNGEYDPTTGIFTASEPRTVSVVAQARVAGATLNNQWEIRIRKSGVEVANNTTIVPVTSDMCFAVSGIFELNRGDTLKVTVLHDNGANQDLTGTAVVLTYLHISEL